MLEVRGKMILILPREKIPNTLFFSIRWIVLYRRCDRFENCTGEIVFGTRLAIKGIELRSPLS